MEKIKTKDYILAFIACMFSKRIFAYILIVILLVSYIAHKYAEYSVSEFKKQQFIASENVIKNKFIKDKESERVPHISIIDAQKKIITDAQKIIDSESKIVATFDECINGVKNSLNTVNRYSCNKVSIVQKINAAESISGTGTGHIIPVPSGQKDTVVLRVVNQITIHNTETNLSDEATLKSIGNNHASRLKEDVSCYGYSIAYHYVISKSGKIYNTRCENEIGYHSSLNNGTSIGIALMGNFNNEVPTDAQYIATKQLISDIKSRYTINNVTGHWGWGSNCPGKNFDPLRILEPKTGKSLGIYNVTRYMTPSPDQTKFNKWSPDYSSSFKLNCFYKPGRPLGGCLDTSSGYKLKETDVFKKVACPPELPFNTKLYIKGVGEVECVDRGSAIKGKRLDLWAGIGDKGMRNLAIKNAGFIEVFILN